MKKVFKSVLITVIYALLAYYFMLPAFNWQCKEFYMYVISIAVVYLVVAYLQRGQTSLVTEDNQDYQEEQSREIFGRKSAKRMRTSTKIWAGIIVVAALILVVGDVYSAEIFHAKTYQKLITVEEREFSEDISQVSSSDVPVVDRDTAIRLGDRKLGELVDLVSQFEVDENDYSYTQISYNDVPTRVAPLIYGGIIKWLNNVSDGLPAYISVDMTTQEVTLVRLDEGMKYSPGEYFFRDLDRYLRINYPTMIFDDYHFEVDDDGNPYWICPVIKYTIGVFGGKDIKGVVIVDACSGETQYYEIEDVPSWVDQAYSSDLVVQQIDYWGEYSNGWLNTIFGQKDMFLSSGGSNYLALDDDVWLYTGLTSAGSDDSNIGFVLVNMRTKEAHYYEVSGATEESAMSSAEGQVQHLSYEATFPLLLNIGNLPTYFVSLKDDAGLVKMYAYVSVEQYQIVGTGDTLDEAYDAYIEALNDDDTLEVEEEISVEDLVTVEGVVASLSTAVLDGNTNYYIELEDSDNIYVASIETSDILAVLQVGDTVTLGYEVADTTFIEVAEVVQAVTADGTVIIDDREDEEEEDEESAEEDSTDEDSSEETEESEL